MLIKIYPENPDPRKIAQVAEILANGGVIIYPTDTVYGLGCDIFNKKGVERVARIKQMDLKKSNFSFICYDLRHLSYFTKPISNSSFKILKSYLPGPFTFILPASSNAPKLFMSKKKTVGIRIPDHKIISEIVNKLGNPIMTTSIHDEDDLLEYTTDPELIHEKYESVVDAVIDGGYGDNNPSTVVDLSNEEPLILRQGKGII